MLLSEKACTRMLTQDLVSDVTDLISRFVTQIREKGYCVIERVIPTDDVDNVCRQVVDAQRAQHAEAEAELARTRSRDHRVGVAGVGMLKQALNATQCFAQYLADERLLGVAEAFFGSFVRISCTDCVVTNPGSGRGYTHARDNRVSRTSADKRAPRNAMDDASLPRRKPRQSVRKCDKLHIAEPTAAEATGPWAADLDLCVHQRGVLGTGRRFPTVRTRRSFSTT